MSGTRQGEVPAAEREPYTAPELTRHGSLDELTQGTGTKDNEKGSTSDGV
jgi:hypothetical protein